MPKKKPKPAPPAEPQEGQQLEHPDLSPEDEDALDAAWAKLDKEGTLTEGK